MAAAALIEPGHGFDADKLSYEIFSILESKFLFGYSPPATPRAGPAAGRVRILSIDAGGDALLAAAALARLESLLQLRSGDASARVADFFDVAAGSAAGGVLAAMLFARSPSGRPLFSAQEAFHYLSKHRGKLCAEKSFFRRSPSNRFRRIFSNLTLKDTVKPVLIPCYDLSTSAPFMFSRADAVESNGFDFRLRHVCAATCTPSAAVEMRSLDDRTKIIGVGGGVAMANPTAAAITHVLNNKREFPFAAGVEDLLVLSLGGGGGGSPPGTAEHVRIAADGAADMVDQAVGMAFGHNRTNRYVRIQAYGFGSKSGSKLRSAKVASAVEEVLGERNVESVLFKGKKLSEKTNADRLEWFCGELKKEDERRKQSPVATVAIKHAGTPRMSPRMSSATSMTTTTTATGTTHSTFMSP